jgi:hypothetical protein
VTEPTGGTVIPHLHGCYGVDDVTTEDFRNAPSGIGPLAYEWSDKPHRLVYDLIREIERLQAQLGRADG